MVKSRACSFFKSGAQPLNDPVCPESLELGTALPKVASVKSTTRIEDRVVQDTAMGNVRQSPARERSIWRPRLRDDEKQQDALGLELTHRIEAWYRKYFLELILRRRPLPPHKDGRRIPLEAIHEKPLIDDRRGYPYISNTIRSSRYTIYDFFPKQCLFQATRLGNFYFICIGIPQAIPGISTTGNYTTILPILFFMLLTIAKEGYDDYQRHRLDKQENMRTATVLREGDHTGHGRGLRFIRGFPSLPMTTKTETEIVQHPAWDRENLRWTDIRWRDIQVGDVIRLARDEPIPADIVLLHADGENGLAYVETMALDGETDFKSRQASPILKNCDTIEGIQSCKAEFVVEDPNPRLYDFNGRVTVDGKTAPLTLKEVIYRGSVLRNTGVAIGMVINTGEECKIRMNANRHPRAKKPRLEKFVNQIVLTLVAYVVILSVGCSGGYLIWQKSTEQYAFYLNNASVSMKDIVIGFMIEFNNVIPLALYVSLEIVKIGQRILLNSDAEMYDEASDTPMKCNTNTILENLGQVNYIFSDKTGTLTQNDMRFRKMSIAGSSWLHETEIQKAQTMKDNERKQSTADHASSRKAQRTSLNFRASRLSVASLIDDSRSDLMRRSFSTRRSASRLNYAPPEPTTLDLSEYIRLHPTSRIAQKAREFILGMALCHTCLSEVRDGTVDFQASSPDELALIRAAQDLGFTMVNRSPQSITLLVKDPDGKERTELYEVLDVIEFSSKRKRMSIIVRCPDHRIWLICKGADSVLIPRLKQGSLAPPKTRKSRKSCESEPGLQYESERFETRKGSRGKSLDMQRIMNLKRQHSIGNSQSSNRAKSSEIARQSAFAFFDDPSTFDNSVMVDSCLKHLDEFASEGLRTLLFAHKIIPPREYSDWKRLYQDATTSLNNRQELIEAAGEIIEQSFDLLGASAIEDKLQIGVPETIDKLRRANIRLWMLTGDKRETAIKIAHSAGICRPESSVHVLDSSKEDLEGQLQSVSDYIIESGAQDTVAVIDGQTLAVVDADPALKCLFYSLISSIESVICCRASPAQKASLVKAIGAQVPGALSLAIGDGANDIAMIQSAHVGVGISGKEGLQAARVADYSIAQFCFLQRLLLVHGRWNYVRTAKFILMTFWKEMFFYMMQALYQRQNGYTGTSLYESWSLTVLNTLFTSLCVIIMGMFEQDLSADTLLAFPELYIYGQRNMGLNLRKYLGWVICATVEGMIVWFMSWGMYAVFDIPRDQGLFAFGDLIFSVAIMWTNWKLFMIETHYKTATVLISFSITVGGWWAWNAFLSGVYQPSFGPYSVRAGFATIFGPDPIWWLTLLLVLLILFTIEVTWKSLKRIMIMATMWPPWNWISKKGTEGYEDELNIEVWQEMEQDPLIRERIKILAHGETEGTDTEENDVDEFP